MSPGRIWLAELVGTFILVFAGTGAIVIDAASGGRIAHVGLALTFGLVVLAMIYTLGEISGAHLNPAVSVGFASAGRMPASRVPLYISAQFIGALLASGALLLFPTSASPPAGSPWPSLGLELILTWILMLGILRVSTGARAKGINAGLCVGAIIALEAVFGGPRPLAPALVSGHLQSFWVYLLGPLAGAVLAFPTCLCLSEPECCSRTCG